MPWDLDRTDHAIHVRVSTPAPPVQDVLRAISEHTTSDTHAVMVDRVQAIVIGGAFATAAILIGRALRDGDDPTVARVEGRDGERILAEVGAR